MKQVVKRSSFGYKAAVKREQTQAGFQSAGCEQVRRGILGNGLSRTAMVFKIATVAGHKLTPPELNKIKDINPRSLERVYDQVIEGGNSGDAMFALSLMLR